MRTSQGRAAGVAGGVLQGGRQAGRGRLALQDGAGAKVRQQHVPSVCHQQVPGLEVSAARMRVSWMFQHAGAALLPWKVADA